MTGRRRNILGVLILTAGLIFIYFSWNNDRRQQAQNVINVDAVTPYLKDGDILCRLGDRAWSTVVKKMSPNDKRFSHLGIVRIRDDGISIINAECLIDGREERVNEVSLQEFLKIAKAVGVYRANFMDGSKISDNVMQYIGRPFDWKFDSDDDTEIYCTELLYLAIKQTVPEYSMGKITIRGFDMTIIPLEAVSKSNNFDEILYINILK